MWHDVVVTLLHTLWQGAVGAVALYALLKMLPAQRTSARYGVAVASLMAIVIGAFVTWAVVRGEWRAEERKTVTGGTPVLRDTVIREDSSAQTPIASEAVMAVRSVDWEWWVGLAWTVGVMVMLLRAAGMVWDGDRVRRRCAIVSEGDLRRLADDIGRELGMRRRVTVAVGEVGVPCVLGVIWPTVLLPPAIVGGVSASELRMVLAHEMAHVRRYDYVVNLLQLLVEAVLFFNPAVWWVSRQVRIEREACCDAIAVGVTREPQRYAEVLAGWARIFAPDVAMGMGGNAKSGGVADRVYRLLKPGYQPDVRLGWGKLIGVMTVGLVLMAGVWKGTGAAVVLAAEVLSPKERVERIAAESERVMPAEVLNQGDDPKLKVTVSGRVRAADGSVVEHGWMYGSIEGGNRSSFMTLGEVEGEAFTWQVPAGMVTLRAEMAGYAPKIVGPFRVAAGGKQENIEIVLDRGTTRRVELVDEAGTPVSGVEVGGYADAGGGGAGNNWKSDAAGVVTIEHAADLPYAFSIRAPGFEAAQVRQVKLSSDKPFKWVLKKAQPTAGVVVNERGDALANAMVRVFAEEDGESVNIQGRNGPVVAKTTSSGAFVIDTLRRGIIYTFLIEGTDGRQKLLRGVKAGQTDVRVTLDDGIKFSGRIVGDLAKLAKVNDSSVIKYAQTISVGNSSYGGSEQRAVVDKEGRFKLTKLLPGRLGITAGGRYVGLEVSEGQRADEVSIDLNANQGGTKRKVIIAFKDTAGGPSPRGTIALQSNLKGQPNPIYADGIEIKDGKAEGEAYVGGSLVVFPRHLLGGWFENRYDIQVPAGDEPLQVEIKTIPAGAIAGKISDETGMNADDIHISVQVLERSKQVDERNGWSGMNDVRPASGEFIASPVPLGGIYAIEASRGHSYVVSGPVKVDDATPMPRVELTMPKGVKAVVRVYDWNGRLVAGVPVNFSYNSPYGGHGFSPLPTTDEKGELVFDGLNPAAPGPKEGGLKYTVAVSPRIEVQPTKPIELRLDGEPTIVQLEKGIVLEGRILDEASGRPVEGAEVTANPMTGNAGIGIEHKAEAKTNHEGKFRFSTLGTGPYSIHVKEAGRWSADENPVAAGKDRNVDIRVPIPEWNQKMVVKE